jgi:hypothetical protein
VIHYYRTIPGYYADNEISKHNQGDEIGTYTVALGSEMLRCAQHDRAVRVTLINAILTARKTTCEEVNKNAL